MVHRAQAGHPGGSLSEIDLMAASIQLRYVFDQTILTGTTETDSFSPRDTHHLECMLSWQKEDSFRMTICTRTEFLEEFVRATST